MDIQVILTADDPKLGKCGQVIKVSPGFARNFLLPHKKAILATAANLKTIEEQKARQTKQAAEHLEWARETAKRISATVIPIEMMAGEADKLFGAVTSQQIQEALAQKGLKIDQKDIHIEEPIKKLGSYQIPVKLHPEVSVNLRLSIIKKA